ncbi:hypothetical protein LCGC14_1763100 [marine sediment metagenome]|uniref:Uncharacterized protein n=1 Tax=marine sediment metagenome TaxID=412755 RepID=A0A0F9K033_9ZZZZ
MKEDYFSFEGEQSEFNAAIATLMRIDKIKKAMAHATISNNYEMKFMILKSYYFELVGILKDEDEKEQNKKLKAITDNYFKYLVVLKKDKRFVSRGLVESFDEWEMELRNLEQKYGMNLPKKEDARFALMSTK